MRQERLWIQNRSIPTSQQGKNATMIWMLEDEGTMMIVQECIAGAGDSKYPDPIFSCVNNQLLGQIFGHI